MEVVQIVGIGLVAAILTVVVRAHKPELAMELSLAAVVLIMMLVIDRVSVVVRVLQSLAQRAQLDNIYLATVLKVIATAYLVGFGAQICRDAGERAVAEKVELAGKVLILVMALPVMMAVLDSVTRLLP